MRSEQTQVTTSTVAEVLSDSGEFGDCGDEGGTGDIGARSTPDYGDVEGVARLRFRFDCFCKRDITDLAWRLPDGYPLSILQGHTGAVTAIAFTPRTGVAYQLLSSSDDGNCRIWDARNS